METIHFLHTNDVHSHFEYWAQIHTFLTSKRADFEQINENVLVFDIGDHVDRSHPFTEGTKGKGNVQLLNDAHYDAVTIGNNEGITMSKQALSFLYDAAEFDVIVGNLKESTHRLPTWAIPSKVYETPKGTKIGVVGATAYYHLFYDALGWEIEKPIEQLSKEVDKLHETVDVVVCLSHLGIHDDRILAKRCPRIDVIFGAHTHHVLPEGEWVGETLLAAAGKFGEFVGEVTIQLDVITKKILHKDAILFRSSDLPATKTQKKELFSKLDNGKKELNEKVFYNDYPMNQNLFGNSALASFFGRALIDYTNADCALFNAGIFLSNIAKGWVTKADIHKLLPHPINVCKITVTGTQLQELYEQSLDKSLAEIKVTGLGFRGTIMGSILHERLFKNAKGVLFAGNRQVYPDGMYTIATLDMFTFGFFFPQLQHYEKYYYVPDLIRDVFGQYGKKTNESTTHP